MLSILKSKRDPPADATAYAEDVVLVDDDDGL
jgi:hypothetical protein